MIQTPIEFDGAIPEHSVESVGHKKSQLATQSASEVEQPFTEVFGIERKFAPEAEAPPVDWDKIGQYVRRELAAADDETIGRLIARYQSWFDACISVRRSKLRD